MDHIYSSQNRSRISSRLRSRTALFLVIGIVLFGLMLFDILTRQVVWWVAVAGLLAGIIVGFIFGRLTRVRWHAEQGKVVTQMDFLYLVIIVAYIALSFARRALLGDFLSGAALLAVTYAVGAGILLGRFVGLHQNIMRVLRLNQKSPD